MGLGVAGLAGASETRVRYGGLQVALAFFAGIVLSLTILGAFAGRLKKMQPVLRFARKLTQQPSNVTKADADAVVAGWDETALYHAIAVTALFNFMNRLVEGAGVELDPAYVKPASERLAGRGYLPLIDMITK